MNNLEVSNTVWQWLYDNGFDPYDPKVFRPIYKAMLEKLEKSNNDDDEAGGLQQILISEKLKIGKVVKVTLEKTSNKEVEQFINNIMHFDLFDEVVFKSKKNMKSQNEEIDEEVDLSDLDIDNLEM